MEQLQHFTTNFEIIAKLYYQVATAAVNISQLYFATVDKNLIE